MKISKEESELVKSLRELYKYSSIAVNQIICLGGEEICQPCQNREDLARTLYKVRMLLERYNV